MVEQRKERTIDELTAEIDDLRAENEWLRHQVDFLKKSVFGSKSEKKVFHNTEDAEQLTLFNEAETEARCEEPEEITVPEHKRKKKRSRAEILKDLPVEEVVHEVEDKTCDKCGSEMKTVGKEFVHDELVYVPAKMFIRKHYVEVVKCTSCGKDESKDAELDYADPAQLLFPGAAGSYHLFKVQQRYAALSHRAGYEGSRGYAVQNHDGKLDHKDRREKGKACL